MLLNTNRYTYRSKSKRRDTKTYEGFKNQKEGQDNWKGAIMISGVSNRGTGRSVGRPAVSWVDDIVTIEVEPG